MVEFLLSIGANIHANSKVSMRNLFPHADQDCIKAFFEHSFDKDIENSQQFDRSFELHHVNFHECCVTSDMEKRVSVLKLFVFLIICIPLALSVMFVVRRITPP